MNTKLPVNLNSVYQSMVNEYFAKNKYQKTYQCVKPNRQKSIMGKGQTIWNIQSINLI